MSYGYDFRLTLFTKRADLAGGADAAGVDRIGPDLERIGKSKRQGATSGWVSDHGESDLAVVFRSVAPERRFVRCNPVHVGLEEEIDRLVTAGARTIMLPMFRTVDQARRFADAVGGRARTVLLVETRHAAESVETLAALPGVDEIHIGLNDLHMDLGLSSHFELLVSDYLAKVCAKLLDSAIPFGVGGIGRAGDESLPVPPDLVYAQFPRLGASGALISRVYHNGDAALDWHTELGRTWARLDYWAAQSAGALDEARRELAARIPS